MYSFMFYAVLMFLAFERMPKTCDKYLSFFTSIWSHSRHTRRWTKIAKRL